MKKLLYLLLLVPTLSMAQSIPQGIDSLHYMMPKYSWTKAQIDSLRILDRITISGVNGLGVTGTYPAFTLTQYLSTLNNNVARPINSTTFTISATKTAIVSYSISISCTATIGGAASGKVALQYSINAGSTWNDVGEVSNSNTISLAVTLNSVQIFGGNITGIIPAGALCRMNSTNSGTTTITYIRGQEFY